MKPVTLLLAAGLVVLAGGTRAADPPKGWEFAGRTEAGAAADIRPRVGGELVRTTVREGATVKKGELLAEIDPRPYQIDLDAARAKMKAAEARLKAARIKTSNVKFLAEQKVKVVAQGEVDLQEAAEAEAAALLAVAKAEVEQAELHLSWTKITAPIAGRVGRFSVTERNLVAADTTRLMTVVAADTLHVSFDVDERTLLRLRREGLAEPGKLAVAVGFAGDEGYPVEGRLDLIEPLVDPEKGTVRFRATIPNPKGLLLPGMFARVRLTPASAK